MESNLYSRLKRATPGFDWQRHEDKVTAGIPDCSYGVDQVNGWVELKTYDHWPRDMVLRWEDLKPEQVNWLIRRGRAGGRCFLLLEVGIVAKNREWLLLPWTTLRRIVGMSRAELIKVSVAHGTGSMKSIQEALK